MTEESSLSSINSERGSISTPNGIVYNLVFVWNDDSNPSNFKVNKLAERQLPIKYAHVNSVGEAEIMFNRDSASYAEILHSVSVPFGAFNFFGGKVVR